MNKKDLLIPFNAPLHSQDTELQTYGCRANNPDICGNNGPVSYTHLTLPTIA